MERILENPSWHHVCLLVWRYLKNPCHTLNYYQYTALILTKPKIILHFYPMCLFPGLNLAQLSCSDISTVDPAWVIMSYKAHCPCQDLTTLSKLAQCIRGGGTFCCLVTPNTHTNTPGPWLFTCQVKGLKSVTEGDLIRKQGVRRGWICSKSRIWGRGAKRKEGGKRMTVQNRGRGWMGVTEWWGG